MTKQEINRMYQMYLERYHKKGYIKHIFMFFMFLRYHHVCYLDIEDVERDLISNGIIPTEEEWENFLQSSKNNDKLKDVRGIVNELIFIKTVNAIDNKKLKYVERSKILMEREDEYMDLLIKMKREGIDDEDMNFDKFLKNYGKTSLHDGIGDCSGSL